MVRREDKVQANLALSAEDAQLLQDLGGADTLATSVRALVADGIRWRLAHLTRRPLTIHRLLATKDSAMIRLAREHADATASELGLRGPLGNRWGFEPTQEAIVAPDSLYELTERPVEQ